MNLHREQKLKFVAPAITVKLPYESVDRPYVGLEHIQPWTGKITFDEKTSPEGTVSLFEPNDVLFGKLRPYLAKVALADFQGACSTEALVLRPQPGHWPPYIRYVLSQKHFIDEVDASTFGAKMPRASWEFIGSRIVPTPDLAAQQAIADFLDCETARIDQLIEKKQRFIALLEEKRATTTAAAVTGQIDLGATFPPPERHGGVTTTTAFSLDNHFRAASERGWIRTPAKVVLREFDERSQTGQEELLGLSKSTGVQRRADFAQRSSEAISYEGYKKVRAGDLISNKMQAWNGMFGISPLAGITSPDYATYEFLAEVEPRFIEYTLRTELYAGEFLCRSRGMGTGFLRLNPGEFLSTPLWLPDLETQKAIANFLDREIARIQAITEKTNQTIEKLRELRSTLITAAVTGQIDVVTSGKRGAADRRLHAIEADAKPERQQVRA